MVALLAEGVDRNSPYAWTCTILIRVALLAEGVDRNEVNKPPCAASAGRPPRGGRG